MKKLLSLQFFPNKSDLQSKGPSSHTRHCSVRVSPIAENSLLLPPVGVWTVSKFQCDCFASQHSYASSPW